MSNRYFLDRTHQKLKNASIHLDDLRQIVLGEMTGSDRERCYIESFLFQLYGACDSFLHELNVHYVCDLPVNQVTKGRLRRRLVERNKSTKELDDLINIESDVDSFLGIAKELRNQVTHRGAIPVAHYFNGPSYLVHPISKVEKKVNPIPLFSDWLQQLNNLLTELRERMNNI